MLPNISSVTNTIPVQTTLVATPLPDAVALRVPVTDVAPSVSNAQVNNNASGNNGGYAAAEEQAAPAALPATAVVSSPPGGTPAPASGVQATFLAQLIGQNAPPQIQQALQGVLGEYEKLVAFSFVKYKPSNALLPPPAPAGVFGRILQQEKAAPPPPPVASQPAAQTVTPAQVAAVSAAPVRAPAGVAARSETDNAAADAVPSETFSYNSPAPVTQASFAYVATNTRNASPASAGLIDSA